jgi:hypothetical protein
VAATTLSLVAMWVSSAPAHQAGPVRMRFGRAWVPPGSNDVKVNWRVSLATEQARVTLKRRVYVEWACPDGSIRWTSEKRVWTRLYWGGPWIENLTTRMKGGLPPNPGGCTTTSDARVRVLHLHSVAV